MLVVTAGIAASPARTVTGINWDDAGSPAAMTQNGTRLFQLARADIWYLIAPVPGSKTIKVTYSGSGECAAGSSSWFGVDQLTPFNAASPQNGGDRVVNFQPNVTVTSAVGEQVIDCVTDAYNAAGTEDAPAQGSGQTKNYGLSIGSNASSYASSDEPGAASVVMDWTGYQSTSNGDWAIVAVSFRPAPPSGISARFAVTQRMG